jgi:hypothetical protein
MARANDAGAAEMLRSLSRLRGRAGVGERLAPVLAAAPSTTLRAGGTRSAMGFAERAPTRLALLGSLPRKREREKNSTVLPDPALTEHIDHALPDRRVGGL